MTRIPRLLYASLLISICAFVPAAASQSCWTCNTEFGDPIPLTGTAEVRYVFVGFSDNSVNGGNMPAWIPEFKTEMEDFYDWVSNEKFGINLEFLEPPTQPGKVWMAPNPSTDYRNDCGDPNALDTADLNAWLIQEIRDEFHQHNNGTEVWDGVDALYITYLGNPFGCNKQIPRAVAWLQIVQADDPTFDPQTISFTAKGVTQGYNPAYALNSIESRFHLEGAFAHEFGHNLMGNTHITPTQGSTSETCGSPFLNDQTVNMGRYAIMDEWTGSGFPSVRPWSYHPLRLGPGSLAWVGKEVVSATPCPVTVRVPNLRDPANGKFIQVKKASQPNQTFVLANIQGDGHDADLGSQGLLIWHVSSSGVQAWDLESAEGKWIGQPGTGTPDPVNGHDHLEGDVCSFGLPGDVFDGSVGKNSFTPLTNPNTNFYVDSYQSQPTVSGIYIDNIREDPDPLSTDMLVDIWVDETEELFEPQGGSFYTRENVGGMFAPLGGILTRWTICGDVVDIQISDASGANFTTLPDADDVPNLGEFRVYADVPSGDAYRIRVVPDDQVSEALTSGELLIWEVIGPVVGVGGQDCQTGKVSVNSSWAIAPSVETIQVATFVSPSGTNYAGGPLVSTSIGPLMTTEVNYDPGTWFYYGMTLNPTMWGPGIGESADGSFTMNGFISPKANQQYSISNGSLAINWYFCGPANVDIEISDDGGQSFATVVTGTSNDGSHVLPLGGYAPGSSYLIRISDGASSSITSDPFTLWTVQNESVVEVDQSCVGETVTFHASWETSTSLDFTNTFMVSGPNGEFAFDQTTNTGTTHLKALSPPCGEGTWNWTIMASGGNPVSTETLTGTLQVSACAGPCPPGCKCNFENSIVEVLVSPGNETGVSYFIREFVFQSETEVIGATFVAGDDQTVFPGAMLLNDIVPGSSDARLASVRSVGGSGITPIEGEPGTTPGYVREVSWDPVVVPAGESVYFAIGLPPATDEAGFGIGASANSDEKRTFYMSSSASEATALTEDLIVHLRTRDGDVIDGGGRREVLTNFLNTAQPNPFNSQATLKFGLSTEGHANVVVHDVTGALVRVLVDEMLPSGEHTATWDGRDSSGRVAATGLYFLKLSHPQGTVTRKLVKVQ